ncbi:ribosome recycling factor domain-containing protein [Cunninghamella echinulata]|nr:ribosome recycling factor domain-containing protein [Cunninghamella echinulata]
MFYRITLRPLIARIHLNQVNNGSINLMPSLIQHYSKNDFMHTRSYAKKSNKKKTVPSMNDNNSEELLFDDKIIDVKFNNVINSLKEQFKTLRVGRANPALLDTVRVQIDDSTIPLRELSQITIRDPQTLLVSVHDNEFQVAVEKSIREAGLNLNPVVESKFIRVPIPKATKETKDKLIKIASQTAEQLKSRVRLVRQDGMKQLKVDAKSQSKDDIKKMEKLIQTMTDKYNKEIDDLLKSKLKEIQS